MRGLVSERKMKHDREDTRHLPLASAYTCTWKYTPAHTCANTITHTNTMWHKHVSHKTYHSKMCNFVVLIYLLCHLAITSNFRIFSSPWKNDQLVKIIFILIPCTTTNLTSVSVISLVLDICNKQHTMHVFLCLASFVWHNVFKIHLYCSILQDFITSYD